MRLKRGCPGGRPVRRPAHPFLDDGFTIGSTISWCCSEDVTSARLLSGYCQGILLEVRVTRHLGDVESFPASREAGASDRSAWGRTRSVPRRSPDSDPCIRYVDVDGVRLRTSVRGAGSPLLLLTGIGASLELSVPFERALNSHGVQTLSLDAPGTGKSSRYQRPRRMRGLARTMERTLEALGYAQVDVLGVSFGGVLAQQLAHQAPQRVRRLVLASTAAGVPFLGGVPGSPSRRRGVTSRRPTTVASPERCTAARPVATPTRCCTARSCGSPRLRLYVVTSNSSTRSVSGPACHGCGACGSTPWCSSATTTPSFLWSMAGS
jgi:hypothetical protein